MDDVPEHLENGAQKGSCGTEQRSKEVQTRWLRQ